MPDIISNSTNYNNTIYYPAAVNEENNMTFDLANRVNITGEWAAAVGQSTDNGLTPEEKADDLIPLSDDIRRCIKQLIRYFADLKQNEYLFSAMSTLIPGLPGEVILTAQSLYTAFTERKNIDIALLNSLGLCSSTLLSDGNALSRLADYIRQTLQDYSEASGFTPLLHQHSATASPVFAALGILAIVARYWLSHESAPQRRWLQLPAVIGNLFTRANFYWNQLSRMARFAPPSCLMPSENGAAHYHCVRETMPAAVREGVIQRAAWTCNEILPTALPALKPQQRCDFQLSAAQLQQMREQGICYRAQRLPAEQVQHADNRFNAHSPRPEEHQADLHAAMQQPEPSFTPEPLMPVFADAFLLPVASAAPVKRKEYAGHMGDEQIVIYDKDGVIMNLSPDYYDVVNKPQAYSFMETGKSAIKNYFDFYYARQPDLKTIAARLLREKIQEKFHLDLDPDKVIFARFDFATSSSATITGWKHRGEPAEKNPLTRYLFTNFPPDAQVHLNSLDSICGIYRDTEKPASVYDETNEVRLRPSDFVKLVWEIDFCQQAKNIIADAFSQPDIHIKKYFIEFILGLSMSELEPDDAQDVLNGAGLLNDREINVSFFDINGYEADNAFVFHNKKSGRVTLYLPGFATPFNSFQDMFAMRCWVVNHCADQQHREQIASHFRLYARQDGVFQSGVDSWLKKIHNDPGLYKKIAIQSAGIRQKGFFQTYYNQLKAKTLADIDVMITSDAEVRLGMWERYMDAANIIPNPLTPFLALGIHLTQAFEADTTQERLQAWHKIAADSANIALMILLDKMIKFNTEGYEFISQVKDGIASVRITQPGTTGKRLKAILEQGLGGKGSRAAARKWHDEELPGPSGESSATGRQSEAAKCYARWRAWRDKAVAGEIARRDKALKQLQQVLTDPTSTTLDLSAANVGPLSDLPAFLPPCKKLILNGQVHLRALPDALPAGVVEVQARGCNIARIPKNLPETIKVLDLHDNKIRSIPKRLPSRLRKLNVNKNLIEFLPENIFKSLKYFYAANNGIVELPKNMGNLEILTVDGNRIRHIAALSPKLIKLSAGYNQLRSLPPLPEGLESLLVSNNQLTELPPLPVRLKALTVNNNRLRQLPALPSSLTTLCANDNQLTGIGAFPPAIIYISVMNNPLQVLPELPMTLETLFMQNNQLTTLPESLFRLPRTTWVDVSGNPLTRRTLVSLQELNQNPNASGPGTIRFTLPRTGTAAVNLPLDQAVALWLSSEELETSRTFWRVINLEENADHFSNFLSRLAEGISAKTSPGFKNKVVTWLHRLADSAELREKTFALAQEATATCEDRVALNFNEMQKFAIVENVERGEYDQNLPTLVDVGRQMFCLDKLAKIASDKVKTLRSVDEIEVYLAFQVQLRDVLHLEDWVDSMRFFKFSSVTKEDLNRAAAQVMAAQDAHFASWFAQWTPWKEVIKRLDGALYDTVMNAFRDEMEHHFDQRVKEALAAEQLPENADTTRTMGKVIYDEMVEKSDRELTERFLHARGLADLLKPVWEPEKSEVLLKN